MGEEADDILERRTKHGLHLTDAERNAFAAWVQARVHEFGAVTAAAPDDGE